MAATTECVNLIQGKWQKPASPLGQSNVISPQTGETLGTVYLSSPETVDQAVRAAHRAFPAWAATPVKERSQVLFRFREILLRDLDRIAERVSSENGKLVSESRAGLLKGIEILEYATAIQNLDLGGKLTVSRGVTCEYRREALGVCVGITPFNFPAMVPMWMIPISLALGNAFVWKPSDRTPLTSIDLAEALKEAGLPDGVFTVVQGGVPTVEALCEHPLVAAVGFVGSTPAARNVYQRATSAGKRALCLGGAKNPVILAPDADSEIAATGILSSFTGCAGQRCMAASVCLAIEDPTGRTQKIIDDVVARAKSMVLGKDMGAIISAASLERLKSAIDQAARDGAKVLLDGRNCASPTGKEKGFWLGPTVLDQIRPGTAAACDELFGPILTIIRCKNLSEALEFARQSPYGNAVSVFTTSGAIAEEVARASDAGMIGVNIGVPVPREPFSFGGTKDSRFGHGDITGQGGVEFWSQLKKVTFKWALQSDRNWMS